MTNWFRVEVSDEHGQIVAIETEMLAGRDIGDAEREVISTAIRCLSGFIGGRAQDVRGEAMEPELLKRRKQELYDLMSDISEDCYCAGWMSGNEFRLWDAITDPNDDGRYGQDTITLEQKQRLRELSEQTNGWWVWEDDAAFISIEEWKRRLAALRAAAGEPPKEPNPGACE